MTVNARYAVLTAALVTLSVPSACMSLNSEHIFPQNYTATARPASSRAQPQIYMYRGGFNGIFSTGINEMAEELNARGVPANAVSWSARGRTTTEIKRAYAKGRGGPVILVGHSLGAGVAIGMAHDLTAAGIPVDLVVVLDPLRASPVPKGVKRFVNFKASGNRNNPGSFTPDAGFDGQIVNADIRNLSTLDNASHWNLVDQADLQRRVMREVERAYRKAAPS